jgi:hypothetical protein
MAVPLALSGGFSDLDSAFLVDMSSEDFLVRIALIERFKTKAQPSCQQGVMKTFRIEVSLRKSTVMKCASLAAAVGDLTAPPDGIVEISLRDHNVSADEALKLLRLLEELPDLNAQERRAYIDSAVRYRGSILRTIAAASLFGMADILDAAATRAEENLNSKMTPPVISEYVIIAAKYGASRLLKSSLGYLFRYIEVPPPIALAND